MPDRESMQHQRWAMVSAMADILDRVHPPVARLRLISLGMSPALRTETARDIVGDKGCLACGNCADACPVMARQFGPIIIPNMRTSMALEHLVGEQCRRCYACIRACPQTDRGLKEYALAFRRGEKVAHTILIAAFTSLFISGLILFHYRDVWPEALNWLMGLVHRIAAPVLVLTPLVYLWLDPNHFQRRLRQVITWNRTDIEWLKQWWRSIRSRGALSFPTFSESHPGRKTWQLWLACAFSVFVITGTGIWIGESFLGQQLFRWLAWIHAGTAIVTDILVVIHLIRVLLVPAAQRLRRMLVIRGNEQELLIERSQYR